MISVLSVILVVLLAVCFFAIIFHMNVILWIFEKSIGVELKSLGKMRLFARFIL